MAEWKKYTVADVISTVIDYRGKTPKKLGGDWSDSGYRALSAKNIKTGKIVQADSIRYVSEEMYKCWMKEEIQKEDILITSEAPFGQIYYWDSDEKIVLSQRLFAVRVNQLFYPKYIYFYMTSSFFQAELDGRATGTTVVGLRQPELLKCKIYAPNYQEQKRIADTLWCLEQKINNNEAINNNLYEQMLSIFNNARRTSVWNKHKLSDVLIFFDNLRKPLSSIQREKMAHIYPYYGAASIVDYVEDYLFDGTYILISEDGANVIDSFGHPLTQYTYGKFWVNNHAHIVKGINGYSEALVYAMLGTLNMQSIVTGAAQPKINQANLRNFEAVLPESEEAQVLSELLNPMLQQMLHHEQENEKLSELRDILLPQLMSGALDVSAIDL